jgi:hypothetical protein
MFRLKWDPKGDVDDEILKIGPSGPGELPCDENAGMLVVNFLKFERIAVMYAEEPAVRGQRA